jgi:hypothetical protein
MWLNWLAMPEYHYPSEASAYLCIIVTCQTLPLSLSQQKSINDLHILSMPLEERFLGVTKLGPTGNTRVYSTYLAAPILVRDWLLQGIAAEPM